MQQFGIDGPLFFVNSADYRSKNDVPGDRFDGAVPVEMKPVDKVAGRVAARMELERARSVTPARARQMLQRIEPEHCLGDVECYDPTSLQAVSRDADDGIRRRSANLRRGTNVTSGSDVPLGAGTTTTKAGY